MRTRGTHDFPRCIRWLHDFPCPSSFKQFDIETRVRLKHVTNHIMYRLNSSSVFLFVIKFPSSNNECSEKWMLAAVNITMGNCCAICYRHGHYTYTIHISTISLWQWKFGILYSKMDFLHFNLYIFFFRANKFASNWMISNGNFTYSVNSVQNIFRVKMSSNTIIVNVQQQNISVNRFCYRYDVRDLTDIITWQMKFRRNIMRTQYTLQTRIFWRENKNDNRYFCDYFDSSCFLNVKWNSLQAFYCWPFELCASVVNTSRPGVI